MAFIRLWCYAMHLKILNKKDNRENFSRIFYFKLHFGHNGSHFLIIKKSTIMILNIFIWLKKNTNIITDRIETNTNVTMIFCLKLSSICIFIAKPNKRVKLQAARKKLASWIQTCCNLFGKRKLSLENLLKKD